MRIGFVTGAAAPSLLGRPVAAPDQAAGAGKALYCTAMRDEDRQYSDQGASAMAGPVCGGLRALFGDIAAQVMPEPLERLAMRLDAALDRGELSAPKPNA